jgi:hypothetical protein
MRVQITEEMVRSMTWLQEQGKPADEVVLRKFGEKWSVFVKSISEPMERAFSEVFPEVHRHPQTLPHEWSTQFDPANTPLEPWESECGPVREMALVADFERGGRRKMVIQ